MKSFKQGLKWPQVNKICTKYTKYKIQGKDERPEPEPAPNPETDLESEPGPDSTTN